MFLNTTFKAFVAEAAAKVAAEISKQFTYQQDISLLKDDGHAKDIAIASVNVAEQLAFKLQEWWKCKGDKNTVMFDPDDTVQTPIVKALYEVSEKIEEIQNLLKTEPLHVTNRK